ncbi:MAG: type II toxin-antitoxin system prevent-host-death family antitoxin, partial [Elusimicrobia bacterium]|nr:type II toxin-antitoxin system prevent-host-death family antitoxin [Elusimicrobiota bacterium]
MTHTAVAELKAHLSRYLAQVKNGEEVLILERHKPVAVLCPLPKSAASSAAR